MGLEDAAEIVTETLVYLDECIAMSPDDRPELRALRAEVAALRQGIPPRGSGVPPSNSGIFPFPHGIPSARLFGAASRPSCRVSHTDLSAPLPKPLAMDRERPVQRAANPSWRP